MSRARIAVKAHILPLVLSVLLLFLFRCGAVGESAGVRSSKKKACIESGMSCTRRGGGRRC